jgi:hypothetical protein
MGLETRKRVLLTLLAAVIFGIAWSVAKGNASGIRDDAGNLSAPWVVLPLLAGAFVAPRRLILGAVVGVAVTLIALSAFYLTNAFVLDLGPHSTLQDVVLTMRAVGDLWFRYGILSGLVFGAGGAWVAGRSSLTAVGAIVATLLVLEPAAAFAWRALAGWGFELDPVVSAIEVGTGLALATALYARRRAHR